MNLIMNLTALTILVHIIGGILVSGRALSKCKIDIKEFALAFGVTLAVVIFLFFIDMGDDKTVVICCAEVLSIWLGSVIFRKVDKRLGLFMAIFYEFAIQLVTLLASAVFVALTHDPDYLDLFNDRGIYVYLIGGIIAIAASLIIYILRRVTARVWLRIGAMMSITALVYINYLATIQIEGLTKDEINSWQYYAIFLIVAIMVMQMRRQYDIEKDLAQAKSNEAMILEREYKSLSRSYETNAKLFHDFRNHCGVLKNYLVKGKNDEALRYLEELTGSGSSFEVGVWTGDETVDYLISNKKKLAEEKGIDIEIEVEFPRNMNIKSSDLCAILGNLLDNAIEACSKVKESDRRKMRLIIRRIQQMLVIKIENTYEVMPISIDGQYQTSKTDGGLHGWGIKSAKTAAAQYDGIVKSTCTEELFTTVVTLSFDAVSAISK